MSEQEVREFEENIVKGELVFSRNGYIFRVKAADLEKGMF